MDLYNHMIVIKITVLILFFSLVTLISASTCSTSQLNGIASGLVTLTDPSTISQGQYSIALSGFTLGSNNQTFSAFALAGFEAPSRQEYYSLSVESITFSKDNTQMNFTMNYRYKSNLTHSTTWTYVKISWFVVSTLFETVVADDVLGGSYIWAGTAETYPPFALDSQAVIANSTFVPQSAEMMSTPACGFISNQTGYFDLYCQGRSDARFLTHSYIMGFEFAPSQNYTVAVTALQGNGGISLADSDEALGLASFAYVDQTNNGTDYPLTGPKIYIDSFGNHVEYVKVAFVITVILDINTYPATNEAHFSYSGVYMAYPDLNKPFDIQQAYSSFSQRVAGNQNYNYFPLLHSEYHIFGLSAFQLEVLPSNVTSFNCNIFFEDIDTVILQSDNAPYFKNIHIAADRWNSALNKCSSTARKISNLDIESVSLVAVPPLQNGSQQIEEVSQNGTYYNFNFIYKISAPQSTNSTEMPTNTTTNNTNTTDSNTTNNTTDTNTTNSNTTTVNQTNANSTLNLGVNEDFVFVETVVGTDSMIKFTTSLQLANISKGVTSILKLQITNMNNNFTGYSSAGIMVQYAVTAQGKQLVGEKKSASLHSLNQDDVWTATIVTLFTSDTPLIRLTIIAPRDSANDIQMESSLTITQYDETYDPQSDCCVASCPANSGVNIQTSPLTCATCTLGLVYNSAEGKCQGCPLGCATCNHYICQTCSNGYYYSFSYTSLVRCKQCPSECLTCTSSQICIECQSGYSISNSTCIATPAPPPQSTSSNESTSSLKWGAIIPPIVAIILIVIIAVVSKKLQAENQGTKDDDVQLDSATAINCQHFEKIEWKKKDSSILKLGQDCAACHTTPGNSVISCGHIYHLRCLVEWFGGNNSCACCHKAVTSQVTVVCVRCQQFYFVKALSEISMADDEQFEICSQCYKEQLKDELKVPSEATT